jgi:hypothetical protein
MGVNQWLQSVNSNKTVIIILTKDKIIAPQEVFDAPPIMQG